MDSEAREVDRVFEAAINAGANDFEADTNIYTISMDPSSLMEVRDALENIGYEIRSAEIEMVPKTLQKLGGKEAETILKLMDALEENDDICALKSEEFAKHSNPIAIASNPPKLGSKVTTIAAPYGLGGTNLALIFNGYYSGKKKLGHFYSLPTRPGSSGAVVMNEDWEAIGTLHTAFIPLEHIGIGAGSVSYTHLTLPTKA